MVSTVYSTMITCRHYVCYVINICIARINYSLNSCIHGNMITRNMGIGNDYQCLFLKGRLDPLLTHAMLQSGSSKYLEFQFF